MEQEWQLVSRRQRRGKARNGPSHPRSAPSKARKPYSNVGEEVVEPVPEVSSEKQAQIIQRVRAIADVLRDSLLLKDALRVVVEHFQLKSQDADAPVLVGYGLGSFCASSNAVHQLGFLVALKEALDAGETTATTSADRIQHRAEIFDPAMNKSDAAIAASLDVSVIEDNEHGRRRVARNTVFFMPHCGKTLYENVLACNWGPSMAKLVIIGNSFSAYGDRVLAAQERQELLLVRVLPYLEEVPLSCGVTKAHADFARYEAAFNDLSAHRFPSSSLAGRPASTSAPAAPQPNVPREAPPGRMKVRQLLGWTRPTDMANSNNKHHGEDEDAPFQDDMGKLSIDDLATPEPSAPRAGNNNCTKEMEASHLAASTHSSKHDDGPEEPEDKASTIFSPTRSAAEKGATWPRTPRTGSDGSSNSSTASSSRSPSGTTIPSSMSAGVDIASPTASSIPKVTFRKGEKSFLDFHQHYAITRHLGEGSYSTVKQVTHRKKGGFYACKIVDKLSLSDVDRAALSHEVRVLSSAASAIRKKLVMGGFEAVKYGRNGLPHRTKLRLSTDGKVLSWQPKLLKRSLLRYQNARSFTSLFGIGGKENNGTSQPDLHAAQPEANKFPAGGVAARVAALPTLLTRSVCGGARYVESGTGSTPSSPVTPPAAKMLRMRSPSATLEQPTTPSATSPDRLDDSIKLHDIREMLAGDTAPFFAGHAMNLPNSSKRAVDPACVLSVCTRFRELHLEFPYEGVRDGFMYLLQQATLPLQQSGKHQPPRLMKSTSVPPPAPHKLSGRLQDTFVATTPPDEESKMQIDEQTVMIQPEADNPHREHSSRPEVDDEDVKTVAKEATAASSNNQDE
ncbi:hypothetical protein PF007_g6247 [Phytophthora fragariae]|uniref:SRR1-like domain-containing protein n=1 Tax=Phytophthora fragariae TaxID=53985 RepID=A0A6A3SXM4_9STRA|nr:hypothetical protein PF007_g6247 [Phytophthora fragariae]